MLAAFLLYLRRFFDPMQDLAMFYNSLQSATRRAGEALRRARGGAGRARAGAPGAAAATGARARSTSTRCASATGRPVGAAASSTCTSRPGRPWRWSARPAPASRRWPSWSPASTTRPPGAVLLDGVDLRDWPTTDLRRGGGHGDPGELPVLRHGRRQHRASAGRARPRDEIVAAAARRSARTSSSRRCPTGYDTDVRKRGGRLSAGQRQLVAFARAFLADPAVLILDEATSSLDIPTERLVQRALRTMLRRPDRADHRPPAVHGGDRRPGAGDRRRPRSSRTARRPSWSTATGGSPRCTAPGATRWSSRPRGAGDIARWRRRWRR